MPAFPRLFAALIAVLVVAACSPAATQPAAAPTSPPAAATSAPAAAKPGVTPPPAAAAPTTAPAAPPTTAPASAPLATAAPTTAAAAAPTQASAAAAKPAVTPPPAAAPAAAQHAAAAAPAAAPTNASAAQPTQAAAAVAPVPGVASSTFAPEVAVSGLVGNPRSFSFDDLQQLPAETFNVSFQAGQGTTQASFTGTRLLNVFDAAGGAKLPNDINNAKLRTTVMVTGADGYQVALGWGELDPDFGAAPIMLAYLQDGQPMGDKQGMARLVVPGDKRGGRYVSTVKSIEIRDPGPAEP